MKNYYLPVVLLLLALLMPVTASAYDFEVDGIYYNKNGTEATVTYKELKYLSYKDTVIIPSTVTYLDTTYTVTAIGNNAFENCSTLRKVTIPNTVKDIQERAFMGCSLLSSVFLPSSIRTIGPRAFQNCTRMDNPHLTNVTSIGNMAFYNSNIRGVYVPKTLTSIGNEAFGHCEIYWIEVYEGNPVYDSREDCNAIIETATNTIVVGCESTTVPNTVTTIGERSFSGCEGLTELVLPNSVTTIGSWAFYECSNFRTINLPNSLTTIKNSAFCYCRSLDNIVIPFSVTELGVGAFFGCSALNKITIPYSITKIGDAVFQDCSGLTSVTIPNSVTYIDSRAFQNCISLTHIEIPNTVTYLGEYAFSGCYKLEEVVVPNSVTAIGECVFSQCRSLKHITLPEHITVIPRWTFNSCYSLASINLHEGLTTIGYGAFSQCESLTNLTIPSTVNSIDGWAFSQCSSLKSFIYNAVNCPTIGQSAMYHTMDEFIIGDGVECIPAGLYSFDLGNRILHLPNSVKVIQAGALKGKAAAVVIGNNIEEIGVGAFSKDIPDAYATSPTPLPCSAGAFINPQVLYVPVGSRNLYLEAEGWNEFPTIIEQDYIRATDLNLDASQITLQKGTTHILHATTQPADAITQTFSWISMDESIATVNDLGLVTAIGPGETDILVYFDNLKAVCHVVVPATLGESISFNHDHLSMTIGETASLIATILPEGTDNQRVEWIIPQNEILMTQETNDNTLDIAALHKGRVVITARTTDGSNLSASCEVRVLDAGGEDAFYMHDTSALHGDTIIVPVAMSSTEPIFAFQTDIYLPNGFTIVTNEDDEYVITPSRRLTSDHVLMTDNMGDGAVRVICYSSNERVIGGDNGEDLFYVTVAVPDNAVGNYDINLRNTLLTTNLFQELSIPDVTATIQVKAFLPGDANDSRAVSVSDIVTTAQYMLNRNPSPFIFEAADMNGDGNITVTDIMMIAHIILYPNMDAPRQAPALMDNSDCMSGEALTLKPGDTRTVSIALDNEMTYCAFQLDLQLPDGLTASNFALTDRAGNHAFDMDNIGNGKIRVLCYSIQYEPISGNSGALLTFDVTANNDVMGDITVDNIELVTTTCQTALLDGFAIGVNKSSAVNEITANVKIYSDGHNIIIETPVATTAIVSDIAGHTSSIELTAGSNTIPTNGGFHFVTVNGQSAKLLTN